MKKKANRHGCVRSLTHSLCLNINLINIISGARLDSPSLYFSAVMAAALFERSSLFHVWMHPNQSCHRRSFCLWQLIENTCCECVEARNARCFNVFRVIIRVSHCCTVLLSHVMHQRRLFIWHAIKSGAVWSINMSPYPHENRTSERSAYVTRLFVVSCVTVIFSHFNNSYSLMTTNRRKRQECRLWSFRWCHIFASAKFSLELSIQVWYW